MEYLVTWKIDIRASSHEDAAKKALEIQRDPNSIATIFDVWSNDGALIPERKEIDVADGTGIDKHAPTIIIEVEGGVASVSGYDIQQGTQCLILDYDTQGFDNLVTVKHTDSTPSGKVLTNGYDSLQNTTVDLDALDKALAEKNGQDC